MLQKFYFPSVYFYTFGLRSKAAEHDEYSHKPGNKAILFFYVSLLTLFHSEVLNRS